MKINKQKGFAPIETVLVIVIIALIAFIAWYVFHTKSNADSTYSNAANTQANTAPPAKKTTSSSQSTATKQNSTSASQVITTKTDTKGNKYLADTKGMTLYTYGGDTNGVSNCTGSCLTDWPVYKASSSSNLPTNITAIKRSDGTLQYAYKGQALYYFSGDKSAGQITGDGVSDFHLATP